MTSHVPSTSLSKLARRVAKISGDNADTTACVPGALYVQLPLWPESTRGVPNALVRGSLFAAIQGKDRQVLDRAILASIDGLEIRFTGRQLDQSDLDVWETLIHLARKYRTGNRVVLSEIQILKSLRRSTGSSDRCWLKESFIRLAAACVELKFGPDEAFGAMLKGKRNGISRTYSLELEPLLEAIYMTGWTQIDWAQRQMLRRKPLAQWLHGWFCSHAQPFPMTIETIQRLSGSTNSHPGSFKRQLIKALDDLVSVSALTSWELSGQRVMVQRTPSASQQRHLAKRRRSPA